VLSWTVWRHTSKTVKGVARNKAISMHTPCSNLFLEKKYDFVFISDPLLDYRQIYDQSTSHLPETRMLRVRNKLINKLLSELKNCS
jgi:hypothetical protein